MLDIFQEDLQKEITALQVLVDSNPAVVKYSTEVRSLKAALAKLREEPGTVECILRDQEAVNKLEAMYKSLLAEQSNSEGRIY